ncbi:hypothetical protein BBJ28_00021792 [Nothophytophthora sp. Chile5]|nr:hypothetical protein BBJ28_00021792 [Nothophytophthora sp. Chile5]
MSFLRRMTPPISASARQIGTKAAVDPSERDIRKELERKELVAMILESIANVPVAVERIHTNEKLREALREEMGSENVLLHRFFDRDATMKQEEQEQQNELVLHESLSADNLRMWDHNRHGDDDSGSGSGSDVPRPATSMGIYDGYDHSVDGGSKVSGEQEGSDDSDDSEESSGFGSEYENDLAEAVNQLCMTDETLTAMEKMISDPIGIANATFEDVSSARISSSPQSSFGLGASPGNASLDGEPVSALWPRQPNQFAFTQEEDGTVRGEDEVYSEMVSSVCEDETFHDNDDENEEESEEEGDDDDSGEEELDDDTEEKVFVMEEEDEDGVDDEMTPFRSGASNAFLKSPPLKIEATAFQDDAADKRESKATNVHTVDIKGGDDKSDEERQDEESDDDDDDDQKEYEVLQLRIIRQKNRTGFEPNEEWSPRAGSLVGGRYKVRQVRGIRFDLDRRTDLWV